MDTHYDTSYTRVLPRDLFNEASLLKCYGRLVIVLEEKGLDRQAALPEAADAFDVVLRNDDGAIFVRNLPLVVGARSYHLMRPMNSRAAWPLYAEEVDRDDFDPVKVFDDQGNLTPEMIALIERSQPLPKTEDIRTSRVELREHVTDLINKASELYNATMEGDKSTVEGLVGDIKNLADSIEGEGDHLAELLDDDD